MWPFDKRSDGREPFTLPLFPLQTVLYPGGMLPLKVFEQRYIDMAKSCIAADRPFGVCLITQGQEVATPQDAAPTIATVGTLARITDWDMPQLGILHIATMGGARFQIRNHAKSSSGLVEGQVATLPDEPAMPLAESFQPLARLLELIATRVGPQNFPQQRNFDDASWVGYRLAEFLPLPLTIKQSMLEINDASVRLQVLQKFLADQGVL